MPTGFAFTDCGDMMTEARYPNRDSSGCLRCRQKKRRCDRRRPVCGACRNVRDECVFPSASQAGRTYRFIVMVSAYHFLFPSRQTASKPGFINLTTSELRTVWSKTVTDSYDAVPLNRQGSLNAEDGWWGRDLDRLLLLQPKWPSHPSQTSIRDYGTAHYLMQYCSCHTLSSHISGNLTTNKFR